MSDERWVTRRDQERVVVNRESHEVPRPPKRRILDELAPALDPALRDMPEWPGEPVESGPNPVEVERMDPFSRLLADAQDRARSDERVREYLAGHRHAFLGASLLDVKEAGRTVVVLVYDYERNTALEITLAGEGEAFEVVGVEDVRYQPPPSDEEIQRATELARSDERVAGHLSDDLESTAILVSDVEQGDRHYGFRRIEIGFGRPDERLPRVRALVDLSEERVLGVGADHHQGGDEGGRS
jgi:hypothetical protein